MKKVILGLIVLLGALCSCKPRYHKVWVFSDKGTALYAKPDKSSSQLEKLPVGLTIEIEGHGSSGSCSIADLPAYWCRARTPSNHGFVLESEITRIQGKFVYNKVPLWLDMNILVPEGNKFYVIPASESKNIVANDNLSVYGLAYDGRNFKEWTALFGESGNDRAPVIGKKIFSRSDELAGIFRADAPADTFEARLTFIPTGSFKLEMDNCSSLDNVTGTYELIDAQIVLNVDPHAEFKKRKIHLESLAPEKLILLQNIGCNLPTGTTFQKEQP